VLPLLNDTATADGNQAIVDCQSPSPSISTETERERRYRLKLQLQVVH
jgi:hypothetical protein